MTNDQLFDLIKEYISCAKYSCELLKDTYDSNESLQRAKILKLIPRENNLKEFYYCFHGRGVLFKYENDEIDIDFGPNGRFDGFDAYRLKRFLSFRKERFKSLSSEENFDEQFMKLVSLGVIGKHPSDINDHLYYLRDNL